MDVYRRKGIITESASVFTCLPGKKDQIMYYGTQCGEYARRVRHARGYNRTRDTNKEDRIACNIRRQILKQEETQLPYACVCKKGLTVILAFHRLNQEPSEKIKQMKFVNTGCTICNFFAG